MRHPRGFALLATLVLMPLLLATVGAVAGALIALQAHQEALHECRTSLLRAQGELAAGLSDLLSLNPEADRLRAQKKLAKLALRTSTTPAAVAYWTQRIVMLQAKQVLLDIEQRSIVVLADGRARLAVESARSAVPLAYRNSTDRQGGRGTSAVSADSASLPRMQLTKEPPTELAAHYRPSRDAVRSQVARMVWSVRLSQLLPAWMPLSKGAEAARTHGQCASTVDEKEGRWKPRLTADRL